MHGCKLYVADILLIDKPIHWNIRQGYILYLRKAFVRAYIMQIIFYYYRKAELLFAFTFKSVW